MSKRTKSSRRDRGERRCRVSLPPKVTREQFLAHCEDLRRRIKAHSPLPPVPTTRAELFALHVVVRREAAAIMHEKNRQYATAADALHNYRQARAAGVSTAQAIFSRLADKHGRLALVAKGAAKLDRQDIRDAQNLLVQLEAACIERGDLR